VCWCCFAHAGVIVVFPGPEEVEQNVRVRLTRNGQLQHCTTPLALLAALGTALPLSTCTISPLAEVDVRGGYIDLIPIAATPVAACDVIVALTVVIDFVCTAVLCHGVNSRQFMCGPNAFGFHHSSNADGVSNLCGPGTSSLTYMNASKVESGMRTQLNMQCNDDLAAAHGILSRVSPFEPSLHSFSCHEFLHPSPSAVKSAAGAPISTICKSCTDLRVNVRKSCERQSRESSGVVTPKVSSRLDSSKWSRSELQSRVEVLEADCVKQHAALVDATAKILLFTTGSSSSTPLPSSSFPHHERVAALTAELESARVEQSQLAAENVSYCTANIDVASIANTLAPGVKEGAGTANKGTINVSLYVACTLGNDDAAKKAALLSRVDQKSSVDAKVVRLQQDLHRAQQVQMEQQMAVIEVCKLLEARLGSDAPFLFEHFLDPHELDGLRNQAGPGSVLSHMLARVFASGTSGIRGTEVPSQLLNFALSIYCRSSAAYTAVRAELCVLPHPDTLCRKMQASTIRPGVSAAALQAVLYLTKDLPAYDKSGYIAFDDVEILCGVGFNRRTGEFVGFGHSSPLAAAVDINESTFESSAANVAQTCCQFMFIGNTQKFAVPISSEFFPAQCATKVADVKIVLDRLIVLLHAFGFEVQGIQSGGFFLL
jgi:hypothetical protein